MTTETHAAGAGASVGSGTSWSTPNEVKTLDGICATASGGTATSAYLVSSSHGFALPTNANVTGISASYRCAGNTGTINENTISLTKDGTSPVGTNKSAGATWSGSLATITVGDLSSDLFGTSWAYTDINASTFGLMIKVDLAGGGMNVATVDYIEISVQYSVGDADEAAVMVTSRVQISQRFKAP